MQISADRVDGIFAVAFFFCYRQIFLCVFPVAQLAKTVRIIPVSNGRIFRACRQGIRNDDRDGFFILFFCLRIMPRLEIIRTDIVIDGRVIRLQVFRDPVILHSLLQ